jgi:murein DD-endopeptidase MepM/ murein hydrolase activator NlpD
MMRFKKIYHYALKTIATFGLSLLVITNFAFNYSYPKLNDVADRVYPQDFFRPPLDIPIVLAGTFGEMRPNHFHSGIDIRTNSQEGLPVYAVGEGYISRIRVQASGFGYALYITHPNGLVSVYAHLQRYAPEFTQAMRKMQYELHSFEVDSLLHPTLLPVKKGQLIAYSGNSGASQGPHLHFEIRDAITEETINPLLCGFEVPDKVNPYIQAVTIYPLNENSSINNLKVKQRFAASGRPEYTINNGNIINAWGTVGIGIEALDLQSNSNNNNGVYSIELKQNGERIYFSKVERFYFKDTRAINSHCDFKERNNSGRWIQKSFVDPGNQLTIYKDLTNRGRIALEPGDIYNMEYIVKDVKGNTSTLKFTINCLEKNPYELKFSNVRNSKDFWPCEVQNKFTLGNFTATFPAYTFYDSILLYRAMKPRVGNAYSSSYTIGNSDIPAHGMFDVWIKPEREMTPFQLSKALIVQAGRGSAGGLYQDGVIKGKAKTMGSFYIGVDSIAPSIKPINISNGRNLSKSVRISVKIGDNLSGIKSYKAYIDDEWVLMNYDQKYALLFYVFDENCVEGKHVFRLVVTDMKDNKSQYLASFTR